MPGPRYSPTFFIIGAPKSGTTSLYYYLNQHPDICMSIPKEPRYIELRNKSDFKTSYKEAFRHWSGEKALGEASPTYLFVPYVAKRLYQYSPNVRLIVILRDPIDRAYSDWWMYYSKGIEKRSFRNCVLKNLERIVDENRFEGREGEARWKNEVRLIEQKRRIGEPFYIDVGHYGKQLARYFSLFSTEQIQVIRTDELAAKPRRTLLELYNFLEVTPNVRFEVDGRFNPSMGTIPAPVLRLFRAAQWARLPLFIPEFVKEAVRNHFRLRGGQPAIDKETYSILKTHFKNDVHRLEDLLDRKFHGWLDR